MVNTNQNADKTPSGRRIIDSDYFFQEMQCCNNHLPFSCNLSDMEAIAERQEGLVSHFSLKCKICNVTKTIATESVDLPSNNMNLNSATVLAAISTGRGHTEMVQEQAILNTPQLSYRFVIIIFTSQNQCFPKIRLFYAVISVISPYENCSCVICNIKINHLHL